MLQRAEEEAAELRARHAGALVSERERVLLELRQQMAGLAIDIAERVIRAEVDRGASDVLIEQYLGEIGAMAP